MDWFWRALGDFLFWLAVVLGLLDPGLDMLEKALRWLRERVREARRIVIWLLIWLRRDPGMGYQ